MKKITFLFTILLAALSSCNRGHKFTLRGEFDDLAVDTILVYYQSPYTKLDTIIAEKGKFKYEVVSDTFSIISLFINHKQEIPIFAYKDGKASVSGSVSNFKIDGEEDNLKMNEVFEMERKLKKDTAAIQKWTESYSKKNPSSYTNIYLLNKYFIQNTSPDYKRINSILANLHGSVKDVPFMVMVQNAINEHNLDKTSSIRSLSVPDKNGKYPAWDALTDKVSLITFWASWDLESRQMQDTLSAFKTKIANNNFQIVSVSLDINRFSWKNNLPQDTIRWRQLCDFKGWDGNFIKQSKVSKLPYTILLDKKMNIIASDIYGKELTDKIKQALSNK